MAGNWFYIIILISAFIEFGEPRNFLPPKINWKGDERTTVYTPNDKGYRHLWVTVEGRTSITFSLRACGDAHVALSMLDNAVTDYTTEIVIGGWKNTRSVIRNMFQVGPWFATNTTNILHCNEYRWFWLSWANKYVEVGRGPTVGLQKFMNYQFINLHPINAIGVSSGFGSTGSWRFPENSGNTLVQYTPLDTKYQYFWRTLKEKDYITFMVKACSDARLVLSEYEGNIRYNTWEVVIGGRGNQKTYIKSSPLEADPFTSKSTARLQGAVAITPNILACNETRRFWIGWKNGIVQVGRGLYFGEQVIASKNDSSKAHAVNAISVATASKGRWYFNDDIVGSTTVHTSPANRHRSMWLSSLKNKYVVFWVKACSDAGILMSAQHGVNDDWTLTVVLGTDGNTKSRVLGYNIKFNTPNILNCNESRQFWISWENDTVKVGVGPFVTKNTVLFTYPTWKKHPIGAISFITYKGIGEWNLRKTMGEVMNFYTKKDGGQSYTRMWRSAVNQKVISFVVKACNDAHILLAKTQGLVNQDTYTIVIGGFKNKRAFIRKNGKNKKVVDGTGGLNCKYNRPFWVSWINGEIKMGEGFIYGRKVKISWSDPRPIPISVFSISTGWGAEGLWTFEEYTSEKVIFYTPREESFQSKYMSLSNGTNSLQFQVRSCFNAQIKVSSNSNANNFYKYIIGGIGGSGREKTFLISRGQTVADKNTPSILACDITRRFWTKWDIGKPNLMVGQGSTIGVHHILYYQEKNQVRPNIAYFSTGSKSDGHWTINKDAGRVFKYDTPKRFSQYNYAAWFTTMENTYITFSVKACYEVHILLSSIIATPSRYAYEVVLGELKGRRCLIRQRGWNGLDNYHTVTSAQVLSCSEERPFWITWAGGHIQVGKGNMIGQNRFMDWLDMTPHRVAAVAFSTGYGSTGSWSFNISKDLQPVSPPITASPPVRLPVKRKTTGLNGGAIAGIVLAVFVVLCIASVMVLFFVKPETKNTAKEKLKAFREKARELPAFKKFKRFNDDSEQQPTVT